MSGLLLAAHGTRSAAGRACVEEIRVALAARLDQPVRLGWVDVCAPYVADLVRDGDVIIPAFLGAGHHVRVDIPEAASRARDVTVTPHLGAELGEQLVVDALVGRVEEAGGPWPTTVIGWAGSTHARSRQQARRLAEGLARRWAAAGVRVELATPRELPPRVAAARDRGERVGVASYLLAPGFFHDRLGDAGADAVSAPLGAHPAVISALVARLVTTIPERAAA
ncbi:MULTISPECIES: sirohydrochlorin chelatase [unclassified Luteococcus]|uniref:sirohydrochlorin chelatase n=1 Tax=unclassified Luteococcus TaxID=2639923 RepID=UPI00313C71BA